MTILHTDTPTRDELERLFTSRDAASVSIYLPSDPVSDGAAERISLNNAARTAVQQLVDPGVARVDVAAITEELDGLVGDTVFWRYQARSLAVLATPNLYASMYKRPAAQTRQPSRPRACRPPRRAPRRMFGSASAQHDFTTQSEPLRARTTVLVARTGNSRARMLAG